VDFSQIEKDFGKHLTSSVGLFEQQMNMTLPEELKEKFSKTSEFSDFVQIA